MRTQNGRILLCGVAFFARFCVLAAGHCDFSLLSLKDRYILTKILVDENVHLRAGLTYVHNFKIKRFVLVLFGPVLCFKWS